MTKIISYKDLRIWQQGIEIVKSVYNLSKKLPKDELYGLSSQIRRAAVSIPSNIAEGQNRLHQKEFSQFLNIALGSCAELETQIIIAKELSYISESECISLLDLIDTEGRQIRALLAKVTSN